MKQRQDLWMLGMSLSCFLPLLLGGCSSCTSSPSAGLGGGGAEAAPTTEAFSGLPEDQTPWTETVAGYECTHVKVEKNCKDGWCKIPAGCFIKGSPESEPAHGVLTEIFRPVILTRSFLMMATEVTQKAWLELMPANPSGPNIGGPTVPAGKYQECLDPDCPVGHVNWWEAAEYANRLSKLEGRQECYILKNCKGDLGARSDQGETYICDEDYELATPTVYDCTGYRFPTKAEFEYAARAGTRTSYYSGDLTTEYVRECKKLLPALDAIAWYCANSGNTSHPVAKKLPNRWGLFDLLGNMNEWNQARSIMPNPGALPWVDPFGQTGNGLDGGEHEIHGGDFLFSPETLRAAGGNALSDECKEAGIGFRLVRSLGADENW